MTPQDLYDVQVELPEWMLFTVAIFAVTSIALLFIVFCVGVVRCMMPSQRTLTYVFGGLIIFGVLCAGAGVFLVLYFQRQIGLYYDLYWGDHH